MEFFKEFHGIEVVKEEESIKLEHSTMSTREVGIEEIVVKSMSSQVSALSKVVHYVHPSLFKPPWMEEGSRAKDFKQCACWEATQPNQL